MSTIHTPVLLTEVIEWLNPKPGGFYIDGTIGLGGHAAALLESSAPDGQLLGIDLDQAALASVATRLRKYEGRFTLVQGNFANVAQAITTASSQLESATEVDGILLDLGLSSFQIDTPERGFSFTYSGPLDMRMDPSQSLPATTVVNQYNEKELAEIFIRFGEERWAHRIARRIGQCRKIRPVLKTDQLAEIVCQAVPKKSGRTRIHPATRVFQALRIYVNNELKNLDSGIDCAVDALKPGGRLCIISFHSLEDRIIKERFRHLSRLCVCPPRTPICICQHTPSLQIMTKRPIRPTDDEVRRNPRSRSAKLRVALKIGES